MNLEEVTNERTWLNLATNSSTSSSLQFLSVLSQIAIIYCNLIHISYFILVLFCAELRTKPLTFVNHAVLANMYMALAAILFQYVDMNNLPGHIADRICSIFEILWPVSNFIRSFSMVLVAMHRYIAVFHVHLFGKIKSSTSFYVFSILSAWAASIGFSYLNKLIFNTSYVRTYCRPGLSPIWSRRLGYALFLLALAVVLPTFLIIVIYLMIVRKLRSTQSKLVNFTNVESTLCHRQREAKFAKQFIMMSVIIVLTFFGVFIISLNNLWRHLFSMYTLRLVVRIYSAIMSSFFPMMSVYYNPSRKRLLEFVKSSSSATPAGPQP